MAKPTETPSDPDMLAGMEGLIAAMRARPPATATSGLDSAPTRASSDALAAAPWHAIRPRGSSEEPAASERPDVLTQGTIIDRYLVLEQLGKGGMGVVYAAYDPELKRKVALKLLRADVRDEQGRARLLREAKALGKLAHPNIVAVHDAGTVDEKVWLAMELVPGRTLREWLEPRPHWRDVVRTMRSAGRGIAAAHAAGLLHRDFKPDNVMIGDDGRVRVMDFGLVRVGAEGAPSKAGSSEQSAVETLAKQLTAAGVLVGTPSYMAPEQFENRRLTAATDQFAFCVSLWEALYGERPFGGRTLVELVANVLSGRVRPVPRDAHSRQVPGWLRRVCLRGLAADPGRRFASMHALLDALSQGRARARARKWLVCVAAVAALGASAALYQRHDRAERVAACEADGGQPGEGAGPPTDVPGEARTRPVTPSDPPRRAALVAICPPVEPFAAGSSGSRAMLSRAMERSGLSEPRLLDAARALGARLEPGDVVLLQGPMGAGKTTFTRALAEGLGVTRPDRVRSPTFNLWLEHAGPRPLAHVDLFRLAADDEPTPGSVGAAAFEALGLPEAIDAGTGPVVLVVEWADLWADPPAALRIELRPDPANSDIRTLIATASGERPQALLRAWDAETAP